MKLPVKYNRVFDKDDNIVEIEKVNADNRQPEYYSIGTHTPMVAAIGETNQHYFRAKRGYKINPETELHKYTKNILKHRFDTEDHFIIKYYRKECCLNGEQCIFYDKSNNGCGMLNERLCEYDLKAFYDEAIIEGEHDGFDADVLLTSSKITRRPVFLEVAVTHPCTVEKKESGNKIIEIFVKREDDAYCELIQTGRIINAGEPIIKFHNFEDKIKIQNCPHFAGGKKYAQQPYKEMNVGLPTKFYCIPQQFTSNPLHDYFDNTQIGMLFASNRYAKPFVFDKAMSLDNRKFVMMGKDIYGAVKPWVVYTVSWNGRDFYHKVYSHFDYQSALRDFTVLQGKPWQGGDTLSDLCM